MYCTDATADSDPDREALALAPGFPPRAALLVEAGLAACAARGIPRPRARLDLHPLLHAYAHALDQELSPAPDDAGLPYRSPQGRGSVEEFFAEAFVAYVARPTLLRKGGQSVVRALEAALGGEASRPASGLPR